MCTKFGWNCSMRFSVWGCRKYTCIHIYFYMKQQRVIWCQNNLCEQERELKIKCFLNTIGEKNWIEKILSGFHPGICVNNDISETITAVFQAAEFSSAEEPSINLKGAQDSEIACSDWLIGCLMAWGCGGRASTLLSIVFPRSYLAASRAWSPCREQVPDEITCSGVPWSWSISSIQAAWSWKPVSPFNSWSMALIL